MRTDLRAAWARFAARIPLGLALTCIALVAAGGWVWSFEEQTRWATGLSFTIPWLLPIVLDGLALSLAGVAFAAALDGRPAVSARIGTAVAVMASATSNGAGAWHRSDGNRATIIVAAAVPIAANLAFEVFLGELRRQVHRKRGMPAPAAVVGPRLIRLALAPIATAREWREYVLETTDPNRPAPALAGGLDSLIQSACPGSTLNPDPAERRDPSAGSVTSRAVEPPLPEITARAGPVLPAPAVAAANIVPAAARQLAAVADLADHRPPVGLAVIPTARWRTRQPATAETPPTATATSVAAMSEDRQIEWFANRIAGGEEKTARQWSEATGIKLRTVERRLPRARELATSISERRSESRQESTA